MSLSRRALLVGSVAVAASAVSCAESARTAAPRQDSTPPHSPSPIVSPVVRATSAATPSPTVALPSVDGSPREWGMDVSGVVSRSSSPHVCLTFDACGGPHGSGVDHALLALLRKMKIPATLFLNERWITANRSIATTLAADPLFEIENHGTRHCPLSVTGRKAYGIEGTRGVDEVRAEVTGNGGTLVALTGHLPRFFRSGTAHYDEQAVALCRALGQIPVGFDVNADAGATRSAPAIVRALDGVRAGSIVIAHMNQPTHHTAQGFARALPRLVDRGVTFARLSDVL